MKSNETKTSENLSKAAANQVFGKNGVSLFAPGSKFSIQPKLTINQPDDIYEREADKVANEVMTMQSPAIQTRPLQVSSIQRMCPHCEEEQNMQRKESGNGDITAANELESYVGNLSGGGQTLPEDVRSFFEPRFGYDFGNVKVHTDSIGAKSAQSINALAYTSGNNIIFNEGQYSPNTDSGKSLLGHELTHVIQQTEPLEMSSIQRMCPHCEEQQKNMQRKEFNNKEFAQTDGGGFIQRQEDSNTSPEELDEDEMIDLGGEHFSFLQRKAEVSPANNTGESQKITSLHGQCVQRYLVGPPQRIGANTTAGPTYGNCRNFNHVISWDTDLRDGYIIQECNNSDTITGCDGTNIPAPNTPHYWEAWYVDASGAISDGNSDTWFRAQRNNTRGRWTFDSNVYAVAGTLSPAWGFTRGAVATAGSLLSTTTGPGYDEIYQPSLTRHRGGIWDCCNGNNSHTPI
jgi:hypothetical protein